MTCERAERLRSQAATTWLRRAEGRGHRATASAAIRARGQVKPRAKKYGSSSHKTRSRAELIHARFLSCARRVRRAEDGARQEARRNHRAGEGVGPARTWRRGLPNGHEVAVRRQED